jgi:hypothetical protein
MDRMMSTLNNITKLKKEKEKEKEKHFLIQLATSLLLKQKNKCTIVMYPSTR